MSQSYPEAAENWLKLLDAATLGGTALTTAEFALAHLSKDYGAPMTDLEIRVAIAGGATADVNLEVFSCADGDASLQSSEPCHARLLNTSTYDPLRDTFVVNWQVIGSGALIKLTRTGTQANMTVDLWIRRRRWMV